MWLLIEIAKVISASPSVKYPSGFGGVLHRLYLTIMAVLFLGVVATAFFDSKEIYLSWKNKEAIKLAFQKKWEESGALRALTPEEDAAASRSVRKWNEIQELRKKSGNRELMPVLTPAEQSAGNLIDAQIDKILEEKCLDDLFRNGGTIDTACASLELKIDDSIKNAEIKTADFFQRTIWTLGTFVSIILLRIWLLWIIWGVKPLSRRQP